MLVHIWQPIRFNTFGNGLLYYRTVKRLLISILQIGARNGKLFLSSLNQNICCGYLNGPIKCESSFEDQNTLFNLLIREISQFLCYERLLNLTYVAYKNALFRKMQFWSHCYTVVSYQALFRLSVCKIPAVYLSGAKKCVLLHNMRLWFPDYQLSLYNVGRPLMYP